MCLFWEKGYRNTSMADLERATGLNPGSLYNAFESKKGIFLRSLEHYSDTFVGGRIRSLKDGSEPIAAIERFFRTAYEDLPPADLLGCLLTNTATELGCDDPEINRLVVSAIDRLETAFRERLEEAKLDGSLPPEKNPTALAAHLLSCYQGMGVIGRLTRDKARLSAITQSALESLH